LDGVGFLLSKVEKSGKVVSGKVEQPSFSAPTATSLLASSLHNGCSTHYLGHSISYMPSICVVILARRLEPDCTTVMPAGSEAAENVCTAETMVHLLQALVGEILLFSL
jgi:hypothetical protein